MPAKKIKLAVVLYTYDRVDDARINQEIIRFIWPREKFDIKIIHCFNGQKSWYPKKYLEDDLVRLKNPGHFQGAAELIDAGVALVQRKHKDCDYMVVLAADTWLLDSAHISRTIDQLKAQNKYLATCAWGLPERSNLFDVGMAVDFFILDCRWAKQHRMFPVDYAGFYAKYGELFLYYSGGNVMLEKLMLARFLQGIYKEFPDNNRLRSNALEKILILKEREPVHSHINEQGGWVRSHYWPKMKLLTHHETRPKQQLLKKERDLPIAAKEMNRLLKAGDLDYYNKH